MNWINLLELLGVCDAMSVGGKLGRIAVQEEGGATQTGEDFVSE